LAVETLFHIARLRDWEAAQRVGAYRISTLDRTLEQEGFIHLSFARRVRGVADRFYSEIDDELRAQMSRSRISTASCRSLRCGA